MSAASTPTWTAVIPVKAWIKAKTRLEVPEKVRAEFARAVALDVLDTVATCPMVSRTLVVTCERELAEVTAPAPSVVVLDEPKGQSYDQLNDAIRHARNWAMMHAPRMPIVVIPADLPALTTASLEDALRQLALFDRTHIPDHRGRGTTLSAAIQPHLLDPRYGPASERAHAAAGSIPILDVQFGARLDVDRLDDLAGAAALGMGRRTHRISETLRPSQAASGTSSRPRSP
jgi:2-phospho-L-lactate guanylyltransferase